MEVYILDDQLRRDTIVDRYESCIWTERFSAHGDFQLVIRSTPQMRMLLAKNVRLASNNSTRVMEIENVENKDDEEGRSLLTVSGRSLEAVEMENRIVKRTMEGSEAAPHMELAINPPATALKSLFNFIMYTGGLSVADKLPLYNTGTKYPPNTIEEPDVPVVLTFDPMTLYQAIKDTCDVYGLGFRLYRGPDDSQLYFDIYTGDDRTSTQITKPAVIFSPDLETLTNTSEFSSIENYKNVALVITKVKSRWVYADSSAANAAGFDRKILLVDANNVDLPDGVILDAVLDQIGSDALSKHKPLLAIDGELPISSKYRYGIDYELGDLVEMRNDDGFTNQMRVTEQIFIDDAQGERSYPTLAVDVFIEPGTWYAWDASGVWDDATGTWADLPE